MPFSIFTKKALFFIRMVSERGINMESSGSNKLLTDSDLRASYKELVHKNLAIKDQIEINENDSISLFHGTSSYFLNEILTSGLLTRKESGHNNWDENPSFEGLTYLTKKWQYIHGYNAMMNLYEKENIISYPCYIQFEVPKALLVPDEDFIKSNYVLNKFKRSKGKINLNWEECLAQYGTVAYLGSIPRKYLVSFTIIGDFNYINKYIVNDKSDYMLDYNQLQEGKGKGKRVSWKDMIERETESNRNAAWPMRDFAVNTIIHDIFYDKDLDRLNCVFAMDEQEASLYNIKTSMDIDMEKLISSKK